MRPGSHRFIALTALAVLLASPVAEAKFWEGFYENFPDVDWLTLETEHFRIHYYPETEWTAKMMAKYAEIAYPKVTGMFDYPLKEKVHIVIRDMEENANGFAVFGSDWVTIWSTPLYYVLRGRQEWIPDCFTHEFTHIVSLKVNEWKSETALVLFGQGLVEDGVHNIDFGARVFIGFASPYWWTEGVAEYGTHLAGFNWWTTARDMHLRTAVLEDNALSYEEMFTPGNKDTGFDREKGYQQGYSMALYVMEKYGKEQYAQMALNSDRQGHLVWEKNIEDVLGVEGHKLYEGYIKWMRDRYERQIAPVKQALHVGTDLLVTTASEEVAVLETLPDLRIKVEKGRPVFQHGQPFNEDDAESAIELFEEDMKDWTNPALLAEANRRLEVWRAELKAYETGLDKLDDPTVPELLALAKKTLATIGRSMAEATAAAPAEAKAEAKGDPASVDEGIARAQAKRDKKAIETEYWDKRQRKMHYETTSGWQMIPRSSPDGRYTAYADRQGIMVLPIASADWPVFSGRYLSNGYNKTLAKEAKVIRGASVFNGYAWSPDSKKILFSTLTCPDTWAPCIKLDRYYRYELFEYDVETEDVQKLTDHIRGVWPSYSPDGQTIAFVHIEDGQNHLGVFPRKAREVKADGSCEIDGETREKCVKWLIKKYDGTQLGQPSWSPDGSKLVLDLYRNRQQDVWTINVDGTNLHPLTWDRAEDRDAQYTPDGKSILYVSDRSGIYNVYKMNLSTREVTQLTNVIGGIFTPFLTNEGNLMYSYFTSYGIRLHGLRKENFYNLALDAGYDVTPEEVAQNLAFQEELPEIREKSTSYNAFNPKNWPPIEGVPMFLYERRGINIGGQIIAQDVLQKHMAFANVLLGQTTDYRFFYINNMWYPQLFLGWVHVDFGGDFSQGFTRSGLVNEQRLETHFPQPVTYKVRQSVDFGLAGLSYDFGPLSATGLYSYRYYTSQGRNDVNGTAFLTNNSYQLMLALDQISPFGAEADINPRGGRRATVDYSWVRTGLPQKEFADVEWLGRANPPGDNTDDYNYHDISLSYTEALPIAWWNKEGQHTLELHVRMGWQNRNVQRWDEYFGGSLHPLRYVPTQSTTNEFAGYGGFSLHGETMLVFGLAYRFPLSRHIDRKFGPFYFASVWGEFFGTAGNFWGYTGEYERDEFGNILRGESYWDPRVRRGTVRREIPFVDIASSNGNYMLYDVGVALKMKAFLFSYLPWNSYVRVAYGLNNIYGNKYDVNDDRVYADVYPNDASRAECEPRGLRVSIGIGSDFN